MKRNTLKFTTILIFALLSGTQTFSESQPGFKMIGWQFNDRDNPKVAQAISLAPEYGINFFIFSHEMFFSVDEFLESSDLQKDVFYYGALADRQKIPYYLWVHELMELPERFHITERQINFDDPGLLPFLDDRYERLMKMLPNNAGLVLTLHETEYKLFRNSDVKTTLSVPERIARVSKLLYDVCKRHNKQLILRTFLYQPGEKVWLKQALDMLPDDIIVMGQSTCQGFNPFYPPDPLDGDVGKKRQIMELNLGGGGTFGSQAPYAHVDTMQRDLRRARDKGMIGAVGRVPMSWDDPFRDPHEINTYAYSCLMRNPDMPADEIYITWASKRYPAPMIPHIISALKRTEYIHAHGRYHLGGWFTKGVVNQWDDYKYYFGHNVLRNRYKWTQDPAVKELEDRLLNPDMKTYKELIAEKDEVLRQIQASKADLQKAIECAPAKTKRRPHNSTYVPPDNMKPLLEGFDYLEDCCNIMKAWTQAYFAQRLFIQDPKEQYRKMAEEGLKSLEALDKAPGVEYGRDPKTGHRYLIKEFVAKMRLRMADREAAIKEDDEILQWARAKLNVAEK